MKRDEQLGRLSIGREERKRNILPAWVVFATIGLVTAGALYLAIPRASDRQRVVDTQNAAATPRPATAAATPAAATTPSEPKPSGASVLTVSGYIIPRERIELTPRFFGIVKWLGVKKGDSVRKGDVLVLLEDSEQKARVLEADGTLAAAKVALQEAELKYARIRRLASKQVESEELEEEAMLRVESAKARVIQAQGQLELARAFLDWTVIRSPVDGVVLEKLVDENELVSPQSFGGERSPSTALVALADLADLQVEIDLNEADLAKIALNQECRVSPEAYSDRTYKGRVAEIAPEANRQKGTLQIKVQILDPDEFLTPQLSAKVEFL